MGYGIFVDISLVTIIAVIIAYIIRLLKQPLIIGYIITGLLVSLTRIVQPSGEMTTLSQIGVALLLFMVGLNMNPKIIKDVGKISLFTGLGQVIFTSLIGFGICWLLGFDSTTSMYIAIAITFSSTIVIMKLLSDKGDLNTLYGKISMGFLIIQDVIAMIILMMISFGSSGGSMQTILFDIFVKGIGLVAGSVLIGVYIIPKIMKQISKSQEFLELFSIGWCLVLASIFHVAGFSIEIGALVAGITLSLSPYRFEIGSKMKPLRDFFIVIFFVLFGTHMTLDNIGLYTVPIIILSLFILIGNPLIVMTIMGRLGYTKKNGFKAGLTVAQISEFSFILIMLGVSVGNIDTKILSLISIVGLITIAGSTYFILYADQIYNFIEPYLSIFEKKNIKHKQEEKEWPYDIILFGYDVASYQPIDTLNDLKQEYLIVDYNPEIIKKLKKNGANCMYGDASDIELLDEIAHKDIKMIVSSSKDIETNMLLINKFNHLHPECIKIVSAHTIEEAMLLYEQGATYVVIPNFIGGGHISDLINNHEMSHYKFMEYKQKHIQSIKDVLLSKK